MGDGSGQKDRGLVSRLGALALAGASLLGILPGGVGAAEPQRSAEQAEIVQWVSGWPQEAPDALQADAAGAYWARRSGREILLEHAAAGTQAEMGRVVAPAGYPAFAYVPDLVVGPGQPELFYHYDQRLHAEHEPRLTDAFGYASWEYFSAGRRYSTLFGAAFGIGDDGFSLVTLIPESGDPVVAELRPFRQGVWAPKALVSADRVHVVFRGVATAPMRGYGIIVESMRIQDFQSLRRWQPDRQQFQPPNRTLEYGDPAACLDEAGNVHWAAVMWGSNYQPTGRVAVDGVEVQQRGMAANVDWLPDLAWVRGRGLVLAIAGQNGLAQVGQVQGNGFTMLAELPSVPPQYALAPPTHLASFGESFYVSTSEGLWAHFVPTPVPASSLQSLLALASMLLLTGSRRGRR